MSAHKGFDLRQREWIPVRQGQSTVLVGLRDLFTRAHELDDLAVPVPPAASGLWRVLYAITARVTGLDSRTPDATAWAELQEETFAAGRFDEDAVEEYFERWAGRFDLFDAERPFGQDPRLRDQCAKPAGVNKLVFSRPVGQNPVWFGHFSDLEPVPVPTHEAAWHLIAQLYYGAAGRCATRTVGTTSVANSNMGPLRGSVSYHPIGGNLFESLIAGLPAPICATGEITADSDICLWERPAPSDPLDAPPRPGWPGGLLTGRNRHAVLLVPSADGETVVDAYVTWAWQRPGTPASDPYLIHRLSKQGSRYVPPADASRALWRDLDALLLHDADQHRPAVLETTNDLPDDVLVALRLRAYGFDQDRQAKDSQWFTATTPPVFPYLTKNDPLAAAAMRTARESAEDVARRLRSALRAAWRDITNPNSSGPVSGRAPDGPWPARAAARYWPQAERLFWARLRDEARRTEPPLPDFVHLAVRVIDETVEAQERPRVAKAAAHARALVRSALKARETAA